jgi:hypothetical protein
MPRPKLKLNLDKGGLHRSLGIPEGQKIPASRIASAKNSSDAHVRKMANFAANAKGWKKKKRKPGAVAGMLSKRFSSAT